MGDNRLVRVAIATALGCSLLAQPAAAQSLSDRFKSLFGGKSDEPAPNAPAAGGTDTVDQSGLTCPEVKIRAGASTYAVAAPGKQPVGNDLKFQATITKTARECQINGGEITARIGIQGRVIAGPAGAPASVQVPLRVAVVQGGVSEKTIATKVYPDHGRDVGNRQRAVHAGGRRSGLSGAAGRDRRQLHLLYRVRPAGPEARTEAESRRRRSEQKKPARSTRAGFCIR